MKRFSLLKNGIPITAAVAIVGLALYSPSAKADEYNRQTFITITQPLEIPGAVLPPGKYTMRLFNSPTNRHMVQFLTEDRKQQLALTFAVPAERIRPTADTVLTMYEGTGDAPPALRTWYYPGDVVGQEFLYPHKQAVIISERTNTAVPELEAGLEVPAKESAATASPETVLVARAEPAPIPEPAPAPVAAPEPQQPSAEPQSSPAPAAIYDRTPALASDESLPQTASYGPLAGLIGGVSFALAWGVRRMKRKGVRS